MTREAKAKGLMTVVWSYPRGGKVSKKGETALDIVAYAAHMAALMGATIIKVKPPEEGVDLKDAEKAYKDVRQDTLSDRIAHVLQAAFNNKRVVVFSGGGAKDADSLVEEISQIHAGGGFGSIVGRNSFQRERGEAVALLNRIIDVYRG